jgi:hypothetical protein
MYHKDTRFMLAICDTIYNIGWGREGIVVGWDFAIWGVKSLVSSGHLFD